MRCLIVLVTTLALAAAAAPAQGKAPLAGGTYGCRKNPDDLSSVTHQLLLRRSGRYVVRNFTASGFPDPSSGTWKKTRTGVRFKGGKLGGKLAKRGKSPEPFAKVRLTFASFIDGKRVSCFKG